MEIKNSEMIVHLHLYFQYTLTYFYCLILDLKICNY